MSRQLRTIEVSSNLFDGKGTTSTRVRKLQALQKLGLVDKTFRFQGLADSGALQAMEQHVLPKALTASSTSGVLIRSTDSDNPRLQTSTYTGDPNVWMEPFKLPGYGARINKDVDTVEQTVKLKPGQKITIS
jgi:hypothetical protein